MSGLKLLPTRLIEDPFDDIDTILVPGALTGANAFYRDPEYIAWVQHATKQVRRMCSVCSGALLLASAGVLDGKRATTHWMDADTLREEFPDVRVEENRIFIEDDGVYTSGGITAGIDLALALIERDHTRALALKIAKRLLVFLKRPGDQQQFNTFLAAQMRPTAFATLLEWIPEHLEQDLSTGQLAGQACMSERTFRRHFEAEIGVSAQKYIAQARITKAQSLLESTSLSLQGVARKCGFRSADAMRYAFVRELEVTPSHYRGRFGNA